MLATLPLGETELVLRCSDCDCASSGDLFGAETWVTVHTSAFGYEELCPECAAQRRCDARAGGAARNRIAARERFRWGWQDAIRFRLGLGPVVLGDGPKRDRNYVDGWKSYEALARALRPAAAQRGAP